MYQRILVPVDGSITAGHGLTEAIALAQLTHGRLRLIHVVDELSLSFGMEACAAYGDADWLAAMRDNGELILQRDKALVEAAHLEVDTVLYDNFSSAMYTLVAAEVGKWNANLIVLGTHGRRGVGRLLMGSGAEKILRHATVPVLLVRDHVISNDVPEPSDVASHGPRTAPRLRL